MKLLKATKAFWLDPIFPFRPKVIEHWTGGQKKRGERFREVKAVEQSLSASALLTFWIGELFVVGCCLVHCRISPSL